MTARPVWRITLTREGHPDWSFDCRYHAQAVHLADKIARTAKGRASVRREYI